MEVLCVHYNLTYIVSQPHKCQVQKRTARWLHRREHWALRRVSKLHTNGCVRAQRLVRSYTIASESVDWGRDITENLQHAYSIGVSLVLLEMPVCQSGLTTTVEIWGRNSHFHGGILGGKRVVLRGIGPWSSHRAGVTSFAPAAIDTMGRRNLAITGPCVSNKRRFKID